MVGCRSKARALAFAAVYDGLPGVDSSPLDSVGIDGTTAARWLAAHRAQLTDAQRTSVDAALTPLDIDGTPLVSGDAQPPTAATEPHGVRSVAQARTSGRFSGLFGERGCFGGAFPFSDAPGAGKYKDLVRRALGELSRMLGPLDIPVYTAFSDFEGINADLNPWSPDCGQPAQACQIRLAPLALKMTNDALVKTLSHELTHCYQARAVGATAVESMPDWLIEGFPSFVAEKVGVSIGATVPNYWWDKWFKRPGAELYGRTYDALGFYAVVEEAGGDPVGQYIAALETKESSAAFHELIRGVSEHFGTIWGATHFRQVQRGLFWELNGPGVTGYQPAIAVTTITNGGGYASAPSEAQAESDLFDLQAEVVTIELTGGLKGRYSFAGEADEVISEPVERCTLGYPCVCPEDTSTGWCGRRPGPCNRTRDRRRRHRSGRHRAGDRHDPGRLLRPEGADRGRAHRRAVGSGSRPVPDRYVGEWALDDPRAPRVGPRPQRRSRHRDGDQPGRARDHRLLQHGRHVRVHPAAPVRERHTGDHRHRREGRRDHHRHQHERRTRGVRGLDGLVPLRMRRPTRSR